MTREFKAGDKIRMKEGCLGAEQKGEVVILISNSEATIQTPRGCCCQVLWELMHKTDLNDIEEGDVLVDSDGDKQVVIGRDGRMIWVRWDNYEVSSSGVHDSYTIDEMIEDGWKFYEEEKSFRPLHNTQYWFVDSLGNVSDSIWTNDNRDDLRRDFLGIFKSKKEAQARADLIRAYVKTLDN